MRTPNFINEWVEWGAGPRASQFLILAAKGKAMLSGRPSPNISDVIAVSKPVLSHRIITNFNAESENVNIDIILDKLINFVKNCDLTINIFREILVYELRIKYFRNIKI